MQVVVNENQNVEKVQVIINCKERDSRVRKIEDYLHQMTVSLQVVSKEGSCRISAEDILYVENVDRRTFLYTKEEMYEMKEPLYKFEEQLQHTGIVRISKNCLLNLDSLERVTPFHNHRFEATLVNGEKLLISRNYIEEIRKKLEM